MIDLSKYSKSQEEAILTNGKHLRIVACAGSGKTTTIAGKVAYLLDNGNDFDISPKNIIAFTYTEKAAAELKNKILNNVHGIKGMANMYIGTIHGWCLRDLKTGCQDFGQMSKILAQIFQNEVPQYLQSRCQERCTGSQAAVG